MYELATKQFSVVFRNKSNFQDLRNFLTYQVSENPVHLKITSSTPSANKPEALQKVDLRIACLRSNRIVHYDSNLNRISNQIGRIYHLTHSTMVQHSAVLPHVMLCYECCDVVNMHRLAS